MVALAWIVGVIVAAIIVFVVTFYGWVWFAQPDRKGSRFDWDVYDAAAAISVGVAAVVVCGSFGAGYLAGWFFTRG